MGHRKILARAAAMLAISAVAAAWFSSGIAWARRARRDAVSSSSEPIAPRALTNPGVVAKALKALVGHRRLKGTRIGLVVTDLANGRTVFEKNPDLQLNPASVTKLVTSAAALMRLGPEFRYATRLYAKREPKDGVISGDLFVRATGDPRMVSEQMYKLASNVAALGIREIRGGIVVDDTYFDAEREGPGWNQDASDRPYQAPIGAASLNFNALEVIVRPGKKPGAKPVVRTDPPTQYVSIDNGAKTVARGARTRISVRSRPQGKTRNAVRVRGRIAVGHPGWSAWRKIDRPPFYYGAVLREMLKGLGVEVRRGVRRGGVPRGAHYLTVVRSASLAMLLRDVNKVSQNFMAEQVLKTMGAEATGRPGSWKNGAAAVRSFLAGLGIKAGTYVFKNGSGLNNVNRLTARQIVKVLEHMHRHFQVAAEFKASLAVAGADGSVKRRLRSRHTYRRLRVKTGWLRGVSAIAGYVGTPKGRRLAFALLMNKVRRYRAGHWAQGQLASILSRYPDR